MPRVLWWGGIAALAGGAVLCVLGWYGVSGERFAERQLPYLASSTVPGAALIVAGAVWVATVARTTAGRGAWPGRTGAAEEGEEGEAAASDGAAFRPSSDEPPVRVPDGTLAHRPDCPLVAGKAGVVPVGDAAFEPCPVCEPETPETPEAGGAAGAAGAGP
ncbi:hypothetical protein [Streptomyces sp. TRM49041]|uniref:hypothetical protein n=1 Tax=Streptomyces sp. TRM49041 TaxID=2603216 RepID=UPI0011EEAB4E|nr:hypothetical protein [Streptomyces sp. TRM49041]